jgi:hypothetical protein
MLMLREKQKRGAQQLQSKGLEGTTERTTDRIHYERNFLLLVTSLTPVMLFLKGMFEKSN